ncbi:MAG: hypothetical protein EB828_03775 [Nitrosopumilus sp. D6]|nr:MAG: hypothetical protein EB828_03775 [Nitrosopumilus sp. D6]
MFWEEYIHRWSRDRLQPRRLVCVIDDEKEHELIRASNSSVISVTDSGWVASPERRVIITGTHDQLFSRAMNRGYGVRQPRWSMHFGLLNNDSMWIMKRPEPLWNGLEKLHKKYGAYRVASNISGGRIRSIPIRRLFDSDSGSYTDIEEFMQERPPPIINPPRVSGTGEVWVSLADHLSQTVSIITGICSQIPLGFTPELARAARYHDWAKSHPAFQGALLAGIAEDAEMRRTHWAKRRPRIKLVLNRYFHDLVGGCAMACSATGSHLEAYLVMTHHGKYHCRIPRVSEKLPETPLGGDITEKETSFEMDPKRWARISGSLYDHHGPFVLAYLESLLRAADIRASAV